MKRFYLGAVVSLALIAPVFAQESVPSGTPARSPAEQISELRWVHGPANVLMQGNATFRVPVGYEMLEPPDAGTFIRLQGNPSNKYENQEYILQSESATSRWFSILRYVDSGHIPDDNSIDAPKILEDMKEFSTQDNEQRRQSRLTTMDLTGWELQPTYDLQSHRLEWAFRFQNSDNTQTTNLDTRILSRTGYFNVIVVSEPSQFLQDMQDFNSVIRNVNFEDGYRYNDYKTGDKLATYGLMGLIAGGTVAVAAKTGLLAGLGKMAAVIFGKGLVIAIFGFFIAGFAFLKKMVQKIFNRQKS